MYTGAVPGGLELSGSVTYKQYGFSLFPLKSGNSNVCSQECMRMTMKGIRRVSIPRMSSTPGLPSLLGNPHRISYREFEEGRI